MNASPQPAWGKWVRRVVYGLVGLMVLVAAPSFIASHHGPELILLGVALVFYFAPSIVGRKKANARAILVLNLFLGWTFIGWVVAMVWAVSVDRPAAVATSSERVIGQ